MRIELLIGSIHRFRASVGPNQSPQPHPNLLSIPFGKPLIGMFNFVRLSEFIRRPRNLMDPGSESDYPESVENGGPDMGSRKHNSSGRSKHERSIDSSVAIDQMSAWVMRRLNN